jgi:urease accessory protein
MTAEMMMAETNTATRQTMRVHLDEDSSLFLLPDAATCFKDAAYEQRQSFHLARGASALIFDSLTAGRMSRGEEWDFSRYCSINELWIDGRRVARDAILLDGTHPQDRDLRARLTPYSCYSTILLVGPLLQPCIAALNAEYGSISQMRIPRPPDFLWSLSTIDADSGAVLVRVASRETEITRNWLKDRLSGVRDILGDDAFNMSFLP